MTTHAHLLPRYKELRRVGMSLHTRLFPALPPAFLNEAARKLKLWQTGRIVVTNDLEAAVLQDFSQHDIWRNGVNAIDLFLQEHPPTDADELLILQAKRDAYYSLFVVEDLEPGVGVHVRDLLRDQSLFLVDVGYSTTAQKELVVATRVVTVDGITMSTGAGIPLGILPTSAREQFIHGLQANFEKVGFSPDSKQKMSELIATLIRSCLEQGASSRVEFRDAHQPGPSANRPGKPRPSSRKPGHTGRNDPCPCGSGRKYKHCCGSRK